jgi:hypothetical protein
MTKQEAPLFASLAEVLNRLLEVAGSTPTPSFRALVDAAYLDPASDFIGASLRNMDFRDQDLRGFNFTDADLTGADFRRAAVDGVLFDRAVLIGVIGLSSPKRSRLDPPIPIWTPPEARVMVARSVGEQAPKLRQSASKSANAESPITFAALDRDDLEVVSTHLQDAEVKIADVHWWPQEKRLVLGVARFDWMAANSPAPEFRRCRSALRFDRVLACKCKSGRQGRDAQSARRRFH